MQKSKQIYPAFTALRLTIEDNQTLELMADTYQLSKSEIMRRLIQNANHNDLTIGVNQKELAAC